MVAVENVVELEAELCAEALRDPHVLQQGDRFVRPAETAEIGAVLHALVKVAESWVCEIARVEVSIRRVLSVCEIEVSAVELPAVVAAIFPRRVNRAVPTGIIYCVKSRLDFPPYATFLFREPF